MRTFHIILIALFICGYSFGQTTIAQQDFDSGTPNWNYTPSPTPYGDGDDDWEILTANNDPSGTNGSFWGIQDLQNNNGGGNFDHTLTFAPIDISVYENVTINFDFYTISFDNPDYLEYEVFYGASGSEVGQGQVALNKDTAAWTNISINIPNTASSAYIVIIARQNGASDYAGLDNFIIEGDIASSCSAPSIQASAYNATSISATGATLNWTDGDGDEILVLVKEGSAVDADPVNGISYTANTIFGSGDEIASDNYVVQSGSATSSVSITGLNEATTYHVAIYEYNITDTCYNLVELTGNFTTPCSTPTNVSGLTAIGDNTTTDLTWINGTCFDEILVVAKEEAAVTVTPTGDGSAYTANVSFGSGTDLGTDEYVVYKGVETSLTVTDLTNGITYHFEVFARKGTSWSSGIIASATPNNILTTGSLIISEIMNDPSGLEPEGEYFEVYNPGPNPIDMNGWVISDNDIDSHTITTSLIVPVNGFIVLGNNSDTGINGNVILDYVYGGSLALANGADEIVLTDGSATEIDRVEYDTSSLWPNPQGSSSEGFAMIYTGSDIEDNNDGSLWMAATVSEGINPDFGSPGINGTDQIVAYLIFVNDTWNTIPTASTGSRTGLIKSNESTSFTSDVALDNLYIKEGADLTITSGNTLTLSSVTLESISNSYSSLIIDGTIIGTVKYERYVNANSDGNDLISPPLSGELWSDFLNSDTNAADLLDDGNISPITYAFGPFDKTADNFVNYTDVTSATLISGTGYRAGTDIGTTLTFTGSVPTTPITVDILDTGAVYPDWNLIGNPYPSYISISDFLNYETGPGVKNIDILEDISGIYGYDGSASNGWDVITLANAGTRLMTPGQGFFVAADDADVASYDITFDTSMRTTGNEDDFIAGRNANVLTFLKLNANTIDNNYSTEFYFNSNASLGLDSGYDGKILGNTAPSFALYSHLVQDNNGFPIALQAINPSDLSNTIIPLGVNSNQGEQITFSISETTLPSNINVYLEDNAINTFTLLNSGDYTLTPNTNLSGTGRFFLRFIQGTLSTNQYSLDNLSIYSNKSDRTIVISGQLNTNTIAYIYDMRGRLITSKTLNLNSRVQSINVNSFQPGIYVVQLSNNTQNKTEKIIIK